MQDHLQIVSRPLGKRAAACRESTVDHHLEETILRLPSHLIEMERRYCKCCYVRMEDYTRLLRVFIASFAESGTAIPEMLM